MEGMKGKIKTGKGITIIGNSKATIQTSLKPTLFIKWNTSIDLLTKSK
jgi:hypothetical protein